MNDSGGVDKLNDWLVKEISKNYRILGVIGEGGYGRVYLGHEKDSSLPLAIKLSSATKNSTSELKLLKRLHHPHLCRVYKTEILRNCVLSQANFSLIVMEKMDVDLADYLLNRDPLLPVEMKSIFRKICLGVSYLHSKKVAHLDLKLDNILLKVNDDYEVVDVKICDFGFARKWKHSKAGRSKVSEFVGTLNYRAPELNQKLQPLIKKNSKSKSIGSQLSRLISGCKNGKVKKKSVEEMHPPPPPPPPSSPSTSPHHDESPLSYQPPGCINNCVHLPADQNSLEDGGCEVVLEKVDTFALGVILFLMLTLDFPEGKNVDEENLFVNNLKHIKDATDDELMIDLLERLFEFQPTKRLNIEEVLSHPWLQ